MFSAGSTESREMESVAARVREVRDRIAAAAREAGREGEAVKLVAVTKRVSPVRIRESAQAGVVAVGENYVQEAESKQEALEDLHLEWHLIGHLQTNKAKQARAMFQVIQTVDRIKIARALASSASPLESAVQALVQVYLGGRGQRAGVSPEALPALLEELAAQEGLLLRGLMGIAPPGASTGLTRQSFALLHSLFEASREQLGQAHWDTLSMGMSGDFEIAIQEGATLVRIGTAIFGERTA